MCVAAGLKESPCSETAVASELDHLREVRAKLSECLDVLPEDDIERTKVAMALSFVQLAFDALTSFQGGRAALKK
jgi:hypothetical protein